MLEQRGVRVLEGELRFNRPDRAVVHLLDGQAQFLEFGQVVVATGSRPAELPSLPFDGRRVLTSTDALALEEVPDAVAVVGAGYIGLEIGTALAKLGARVTVVEALDRVLPSIDESLSRPVLKRLTALGIDVELRATVRGREEGSLVLDGPGGERSVPADAVIVAVGRVPNTDDLGLDALGVRVGADGLIAVDEQMVATPGVAAIGDVVAGPALAHRASAQGLVAAEALCGLPVAFEPQAIPLVVFTDPEIASVGLTEDAARAGGYEARAASWPLAASGRAATLGGSDGAAHVVVDMASDRVLGVHVVGPHASEVIAAGTLAVEMMASPRDLADTIHPHPTIAESLQHAAARLAERVTSGASRP